MSAKRARVRAFAAACATAAFAFGGCGGGGGGGAPSDDGDGGGPPPGSSLGGVAGTVKVLGANDLGMHCMDREFATFSILPPYNVIRAQAVLLASPKPRLLDGTQVYVKYAAATDGNGSINSRSIGKTDFWLHAKALFGADLLPGQGLKGLYMPLDAPVPGPQSFLFGTAMGAWAAEGIPITPWDDSGGTNPYPLLHLAAYDRATGVEIAHTDVVVPVAQETECRTCHRTGGLATLRSGIAWSANPDLEVQAKENVLLLHDADKGTALFGARPVLCAQCHYSPALDLAGAGPLGAQLVVPWFSRALHRKHDFLPGGAAPGCYQCHPGAITQCSRGAMATAGIECRDCHGDMKAVAGEFPLLAGGSLEESADGATRRAWTDLPRCQSCHTGDAVSHLAGPEYVAAADGIHLRQAWKVGDASASAISAPGSRFAENARTLYRFSKGHGGLLCQACHGSTHAEWPVGDVLANDNVTATQIQGHTGVIRECGACHAAGTLALTLGGPHGMHTVGDWNWANGGHGDFYEQNPSACLPCHGINREGTALSRAGADRPWWNVKRGDVISCTRCHAWPPPD